jgi:hypothetical protein
MSTQIEHFLDFRLRPTGAGDLFPTISPLSELQCYASAMCRVTDARRGKESIDLENCLVTLLWTRIRICQVHSHAVTGREGPRSIVCRCGGFHPSIIELVSISPGSSFKFKLHTSRGGEGTVVPCADGFMTIDQTSDHLSICSGLQGNGPKPRELDVVQWYHWYHGSMYWYSDRNSERKIPQPSDSSPLPAFLLSPDLVRALH